MYKKSLFKKNLYKKNMMTALLGLSITLFSASCSSINPDSPELSSEAESILGEIYEVNQEELNMETGYYFDAPSGASDITYHLVGYQDMTVIPEITFQFDGLPYCYRANITNLTSMEELTPFEQLSESEGTWDQEEETSVSGLPALYRCKKDRSCLYWLDSDAGILYTLDCQSTCDADTMKATAEKAMETH